ncbi:MAG: hypothetical protein ACRCW2_04800, partial [Cellulosilyticaceae bacterium]
GETVVDAYVFANNEVEDYITKREALYRETESYYNRKGLQVRRAALGSQDGEYVALANNHILYLLDPSAVEIWEKSKDIEGFLENYKKFLDEM